MLVTLPQLRGECPIFYLTLARAMAGLLHKDIQRNVPKDFLAAVLCAPQLVIVAGVFE